MQAFVKESQRIIKKASENNKIAFFVGAGVSINSGFPSWTELVEEFKKGLDLDKEKLQKLDLLKIPQYYFNSRGEKEYNDIVKTVFNIPMETNELHYAILNFDPQYIVTTNYDQLLELAAEERGMFYNVIAKDADLPYSTNNKNIVKMHGDLQNMNFVLKEDDYLSYDSNFRLISNFIKTILSTHVVVFVGYSLQDTDFNLLFQSVKDVLQKDFQQAYLLITDPFDMLEYEYYKKRGINVLYYDQIMTYYDSEDCESISIGERTRKMLEFLHKGENEVSDDINGQIDLMYNKLQGLHRFDRLRQKDIQLIFDHKQAYVQNDMVHIHHESIEYYAAFITALRDFKQYEQHGSINCIKDDERRWIVKNNEHKIKRILNCLTKADVKGFMFYKNAKNFEEWKPESFIISENNEESLSRDNHVGNMLLTFDYQMLHNDNKKMILPLKDSWQELKRAFKFYQEDHFFETYTLLKNLSQRALREKDFFIYLLSEFNRKNVGRILADDLFTLRRITEEQWEEIKEEVKLINVEDIYLNMPKTLKSSLQFMQEYINFSFVYMKSKDMVQFVEKFRKDLKSQSTHNYGGTIGKLKKQLKEFWFFTNENSFMIEHFSDVRSLYYSYVRSAIESHINMQKKSAEDDDSISSFAREKIGLEYLDSWDVFFMVRYLKAKQIRELFEEFHINEMKLRKHDIDNSVNILKNMAELYENLPFDDSRNEYVLSWLIIHSKVKFNEDQISTILDCLMILLKDRKCMSAHNDVIREMNRFIVLQSNLSKEILQIEQLKLILEYLMTNYFLGLEKPNEIPLLYIFINNLCDILFEINNKYKLKVNHDLFRREELFTSISNWINIFLPLSKILDKEKLDVLKKQLIKYLENTFDVEVYTHALRTPLLLEDDKLKESYEEKLFAAISDSSIAEKKKQVLQLTGAIFLRGDLLNPDRFLKFKGVQSEYDWLVDPGNFNYEKFNIAWLTKYYGWVHEKISECEVTRKKVREVVKKHFLENAPSENELRIFLKYYS